MKKIYTIFLLLVFAVTTQLCAEACVFCHIVEMRGTGNVKVVKYKNGGWQLFVGTEPYIVRGMEYSPDKVGKRPDESNEWMKEDSNNNIKCDGPYDSWVDKNDDNYQDSDEETIGDFQLLKEMGCNTIRIYHPSNINKEILRDLYENYGIRVIMGNFFGAYTIGSGADWSTGTDYTNAEQRRKMKEEIRNMVTEYKDEPYILLWMLGNENDLPGSYENSTCNNTNAAQKPIEYARFVGEICRMIKKLDPDHPIGVCNGYYKLLPYYKKYAPEIDIIGMNAYTGPYGFGSLWTRIKASFDRPVLITEYGTDCYNMKKQEIDEDYQAEYHRKAWLNIESNTVNGNKAQNAIGGVIYYWMDKWWLCGSPENHDTEAGAWPGPTIDGFFNDEWMGICGQGNGSRSPFKRHLRKAYFVYKDELWKKYIH